MKSPRIIVSVTNDLYTDQRVDKVCSWLHENGYRVLLVGRKLKHSKSLANRPYATHRMRLLFTKGPLFYAFFNLRLLLFLLFRKADVLLSNDLDTLLANYAASRLKGGKKLVYDSHELFTEVPELTSRPKVRNYWLAIERQIFPRLKHIYTVNDSIAGIYEKRYGVSVGVVRNVSPRWEPENLRSREEMGLPVDQKLIILQGAGINIDRGAEEAVEAMKRVGDAVLLVVGSGDVIPQLKKRVQRENLNDRVRFVDRVPYQQMMNYTYHADLGLTLDKDTNPNYRFSLPNKVFDYIHARTPVLTSPVVEVAKLVRHYAVGEVVDVNDPDQIAVAINGIFQDEKRLATYKNNCDKARKMECWENEQEKLRAYFPPVS
ncbi:MAG: glycosyltransferase [Bacteroidota bacterium]